MSGQTLPQLVDSAAKNLAGARTAAEILDARDKAAMVYDMAKRAGRLLAARNAYDDLIPRIHRAQADALVIEAEAKRRLADEYDAAQKSGDVAKIGDNLPSVPERNSKPTAAEIGLSRKAVYEARAIRDAEKAEPGIVRRTVDEALAAGEEPTKAKLRRAVETAAKPAVHEPAPKIRIGQREMNADLWRGLRESVETLAAMPRAADVVAALWRNRHAGPLVEQRLPQALTFLKEFSDAWQDR